LSSRGRQELIADLMRAMRRVSAQGVLFSQAVATRAGIASSDLECLDIILLAGRVTAGELARATGLTTGAITGVADRLERSGLVRRVRDSDDRRKVWLQVLPRAERQLGPWFASLATAVDTMLRDYDVAFLESLLEFYRRASMVMVAETAKLRSAADRPGEIRGDAERVDSAKRKVASRRATGATPRRRS